MSDAYVPASEFVICCASATDYVNPHQSPSPSPFWVLSDYFLAHCIGFRRAVIESAALFSCLKIQQWLVFHLTNEQRIRAFREAIASLFVVPPAPPPNPPTAAFLFITFPFHCSFPLLHFFLPLSSFFPPRLVSCYGLISHSSFPSHFCLSFISRHILWFNQYRGPH